MPMRRRLEAPMPEPLALELVFTSEIVANLVGQATNREPVRAGDDYVIGIDLNPGEGVDVQTPLGTFGFFISEARGGAILAKIPMALAAVIPPFPYHSRHPEMRPARTVYEIDISGSPASINALLLGRISVRLR